MLKQAADSNGTYLSYFTYLKCFYHQHYCQAQGARRSKSSFCWIPGSTDCYNTGELWCRVAFCERQWRTKAPYWCWTWRHIHV